MGKTESGLKIKLRQAGYRLVYQVEDEIITVTVIAVGKRERNFTRYQARLGNACPPSSAWRSTLIGYQAWSKILEAELRMQTLPSRAW